MRLRVASDIMPGLVSRLVGWTGDRPIYDADDGAVVLELVLISALREPMALDRETEKMVRRYKREIQRAKICEPDPAKGEYVGACHWSKTGWAIQTDERGCGCRPARAPSTNQ